MKHVLCIFVIIHLSFRLLSQTEAPSSKILNKPVIDSSAIANWADLLWSEPSITPDGKYFMYPIDNLPASSKTLVIQSTENEWKKEFVGADKGFFSGNSKLAVFKTNDTLYILSLGKDEIVVISNVLSYKTPNAVDGKLLAYLTKNNKLVLHNLVTRKEQLYQNVAEYQFDDNGTVLLIKTKLQKEGMDGETVQWIDFFNNKAYIVWETANDKNSSASRFSFDKAGKQLMFMIQDKSRTGSVNSIWYYKEGMNRAIEKVSNETPGIDSGMIVSTSAPTFSKNGKYIFFKIQPKPEPPLKPDPNAVQVDVWSYKDVMLQEYQLYLLKAKFPVIGLLWNEFEAYVSVEESGVIRLGVPGVINNLYVGQEDFAIVGYKNYKADKSWLKEPTEYFLVFLPQGVKTTFKTGYLDQIVFSLDGNYIVFYDYESANFFSYNLSKKEFINISENIRQSITLQTDQNCTKNTDEHIEIGGWVDSLTVILNDKYDVWKVDITGKEKPVSLTNGYGEKMKIKFRLLQNSEVEKRKILQTPLLLAAFDLKNKNNGFYSIQLNASQIPKKIYMDTLLLYTESSQTTSGLLSLQPIKAKKAETWIVKRQSATQAPDFFLTKDFQYYKQLTNVQPQKKCNWLTAELLTWKQFDGELCQGILYKPENFDGTKKYPVIVNYYESRSDEVHQFIRPDFTSGAINIPWFVSREYLVFVPDIRFTIGKTGESVVNSVVSGVKNLFQLPYIDSTKVGIQGHSFGGYETNYLITHTNIFAAAAEGAGASDLISNYGTLILAGSPILFQNISAFESLSGQYRLNSNPFEARDIYVTNSPIFYADKVTTPLLMMHNKKDQLVPWSQAVEFFIALRRLDKKVWMLQYDNGGHISDGKEAVDFTYRITQFFDHFLKNIPAPKWMTQGIPATLKGIDRGF